MAHPMKSNATKGYESKLTGMTAGAASGPGRLQKIALQEKADANRADGGAVEKPERYDLRSPEGLAAAKQKLNSVGLGRAVTVAPPSKDRK